LGNWWTNFFITSLIIVPVMKSWKTNC
jgi:hypothetical protein